MFCGHCGQLNPDTNTQCASCGKEVRVALNPAAPPPVAMVAPSQAQPLPQTPEGYDATLDGIGGWLLFFIIGTTILTPIVLLAEASQNLNNPTVIILDLALTALALWTGISLLARGRYALPLVRTYFIAQLVLAVLIILGSVAGNLSGDIETDVAAGRSGLYQGIRIFGVVGLWWAYFKKSVRVLSTYGSNL